MTSDESENMREAVICLPRHAETAKRNLLWLAEFQKMDTQVVRNEFRLSADLSIRPR